MTIVQSSRWKLKTLDELANVGAGNPAPQDKKLFEGGKYPFIRTSDVGQIRFGEINTAADLLNEQGVARLRLVPKGTVLMPKSGASTFLNHRVMTTADAFVSSHLATITPKDGITDPRFLLYALSQVSAQDLLPENSYPSLNLNLIKTIKIPLPTLEEQQQIAAVLDDAFEGLAHARAHAEANLQNARELFPAILTALFTRTDENWSEKTLEELCEKITDGTHQTPKYYDNGYIFLSSKNVTSGKIDWENIKYIDEAQHLAMQKRLSPQVGDVLLAKNGTTGVAAIVDRDVTFDIYVSLALLRSKGEILPEFLLYFINSSLAKDQFNKRLKGSGVPNLHLQEIRQVRMPYPTSKVTQEELVHLFDRQLKECEAAIASCEAKLKDLDDLRQSLLQKAFAGELT